MRRQFLGLTSVRPSHVLSILFHMTIPPVYCQCCQRMYSSLILIMRMELECSVACLRNCATSARRWFHFCPMTDTKHTKLEMMKMVSQIEGKELLIFRRSRRRSILIPLSGRSRTRSTWVLQFDRPEAAVLALFSFLST